MLKELFSNRLFIGALVFFILCVGGSLFYMQQVQQIEAEKLAETEERVKQFTEKQQPQPTAKAPVADTSQGGHWHGDEWHAEPHPPVEVRANEPSDDPVIDFSEVPEDIPKPDIPLPANVKNMELKEWQQWLQKHNAEWQKYVHALDPAIKRLDKEVDRLLAAMPPKDSPDYAAARAKYSPVVLEHNRMIVEKGRRGQEWSAAIDAAFEAYNLARFGKK